MNPTLVLPDRLVVPLFPLPNAILFPGARLPLYIFEPRYKQMIDDAMVGERLLSVALESAQPGEGTRSEVCGLGQITEMERLPKNEKNIVVTGIARVRILREVESDPYVRAEVEALEESGVPGAEIHEDLFWRLREAARTWLFRMRTGNVRQLADFGHTRTVSEMCDFFGAYLLDDVGTRQKLLDELDVTRRARFIIELVNSELYRYSAPFEN